MRLVGALGVLCLVAAPAAAATLPVFDVTNGSLVINATPPFLFSPATISTGMVGTFEMTFTTGMEHIGDSTALTVDDVDVTSTAAMQTTLPYHGHSIYLQAGSARFTDFDTSVPGHLDGGIASPVGSAYLEVTLLVVGSVITTTFSTVTAMPANNLMVTVFPPTTTGGDSAIITATIGWTQGWEIGLSIISLTLTLDFVVSLEGTTHVPEPALGSLVALGLGGAGAWLRRRRS